MATVSTDIQGISIVEFSFSFLDMLPDRLELPVPATARENKDSNLV
jgi:hypothetical protein